VGWEERRERRERTGLTKIMFVAVVLCTIIVFIIISFLLHMHVGGNRRKGGCGGYVGGRGDGEGRREEDVLGSFVGPAWHVKMEHGADKRNVWIPLTRN
jgi:hypothetical protein